MKKFKMLVISLIFLSVGLFAQDADKKITKSYEMTFTVNGMTCEGCVAHVNKTLKEIEGVSAWDVKLKENLAVVEFDPKVTNGDKIEEALKKTGFEIKKQGEENKTNDPK